MKKISVLSAFLAISCLSVLAQKLEVSKIPIAVKNAFAKKYPNTTASWEKEGLKFKANFKQNGNTMSALFQPNGIITESEMDIKVSDLPTAVVTYVKEHYKGKTIKEGAIITKLDGTVNYEAEVDGKDLVFSEKRVFLSISKD